MADPKFQNFFDKIKNHQGAVDAMMKVGEIMKAKGRYLSYPSQAGDCLADGG
jgi:hypothetical protein